MLLLNSISFSLNNYSTMVEISPLRGVMKMGVKWTSRSVDSVNRRPRKVQWSTSMAFFMTHLLYGKKCVKMNVPKVPQKVEILKKCR